MRAEVYARFDPLGDRQIHVFIDDDADLLEAQISGRLSR
jgi:hypothetical protein